MQGSSDFLVLFLVPVPDWYHLLEVAVSAAGVDVEMLRAAHLRVLYATSYLPEWALSAGFGDLFCSTSSEDSKDERRRPTKACMTDSEQIRRSK